MKGTDIDLYYEVHGEGKPLVFAHGWMDDCTMWNAQVEYFAKQFKVIIYDHIEVTAGQTNRKTIIRSRHL